jgi:excinuclease ABC subunit C
MSDLITSKLSTLPDAPGVYLHKNADGKVLYIGKARSLRNRVRSYFAHDGGHSPFTRKMVKLIVDFDVIVTRTEKEALILENNLVKMHKPHFNIRLKDDKRYPYLKLTLNEEYPALLEVRQPKNDKAAYFGPYVSSIQMRQMVSLAKKIFKIRAGALVSERRWRGCPWRDTSKFLEKPCLQFYISRCSGPCIQAISQEEYKASAQALHELLQGNCNLLLRQLKAEMASAAEQLEFEKAGTVRDQIEAVQSILEKQRVLSVTSENYDALGLHLEAGIAAVALLQVRDGKLIGELNFFLQNVDGREKAEVLSSFLRQHYDVMTALPSEILTPVSLEDAEVISEWLSDHAQHKVTVRAPQRGAKTQVMDMTRQNAELAMREQLNQNETARRVNLGLLTDLQTHLNLPTLPERIECFDISTVQGAFSVGSMVVFKGGKSDKKSYRHFTIKHTLELTGGTEPNDFEMMREVLRRRLQRALDGDSKFLPLPDLLVVDGGKGQLSAALEILKEKDLEQIPTVGLAKQHELLYMPHKSEPLALPRNSPALHLMQRIRDEAHRFAITHHRRKRGKSATKSLLDDIPGIGEARRTALLEHFGSVQRLRAAGVEEIVKVPGMSKASAEKLQEYLELLLRG